MFRQVDDIRVISLIIFVLDVVLFIRYDEAIVHVQSVDAVSDCVLWQDKLQDDGLLVLIKLDNIDLIGVGVLLEDKLVFGDIPVADWLS